MSEFLLQSAKRSVTPEPAQNDGFILSKQSSLRIRDQEADYIRGRCLLPNIAGNGLRRTG
jgi:hypothetical protein